ncbi:ARM repeat-containing protein [Microstroma glucosiphilum]|uniref:ARM repeat-containing protein n=1 Tax=Pseudomicrostroma glucosiphilum TaxID=1684307 RepID=A0A316TXI0_9BASI|nr:ARM repeat-containing protein [Pseudomicrostroma glucosiphilum]PWN17967.1 ARM repeat-containing protein [Pseudomicrostroma glucosiphilum]
MTGVQEDSHVSEGAPSASASSSLPSTTSTTLDFHSGQASQHSSQPSASSHEGSPSTSQVLPIRHPAPLRAADVEAQPPTPTISASSGKHHHHQRSRSVNLSPTIPGAPFAGNMGSFSWESPATRQRAASPLHNTTSAASRATPMSRPASHPGPVPVGSSSASSSSSSSSHSADAPYSRSPESKRNSFSPSNQQVMGPASWDSLNRRSSSPARGYGIPLSPRLQAFGSNRGRRPSSGGSGSGRGGNVAVSNRPSSPVPLPSSPRAGHLPIPAGPDPEHPFDSVWPSEGGHSPLASPRGRDAASNWASGTMGGPSDRSNSRSPSRLPNGTLGGRRSPFDRQARSSGSSSSGSPTQSKGIPFGLEGLVHRRSLSGSASLGSSPSSSSSASPPAFAGLLSHPPHNQRDGPFDAAQPAPAPPLTSLKGQSDAAVLPSELSPIFKVISPSKSTSQVDSQNAHAQGTPTGEDPPDLDQDFSDDKQAPSPVRRPSSDYDSSGSSAPIFRTSSPFLPRPQTPKTGASPSSPANLGSVSPPKTRSFIGMPPRSGYDLSDDPDDVGSEDGASVSSGKDSASNADDDDDRDMEDTEADMEGQRDGHSDAEDEAFSADEEDTASCEKRRAAAADQLGGGEGHDGGHGSTDRDGNQTTPSFAERPAMPPKRPSLSRSSAVPTPPESPSMASGGMMQYFRDPSVKSEGMPWEGSHDANLQSTSEAAQESLGDIAADEVDLAQRDGNDALLDGVDIHGNGTMGDMSQGAPTPDQPNADAATAALSAEMEQPEESLSTLERIFLFAKSEMTYHRVIVSRSLPAWIREVELSEAVEYVIPLLNGLATDEPDVCTAFAAEVHHVMWYFYRNCPLAELESQDAAADMIGADESGSREMAIRPRIPVGIFTPLLCALLLNQNSVVASTAQSSVVSFFQLLHARESSGEGVDAETSADDIVVPHAEGRDGEPVAYDNYSFGPKSKETIIDELLEHVALAMGKSHSGHEEQLSEPQQPGGENGGESHAGTSDAAGANTADGASSSPIPFKVNAAEEGDSSWDAEMQDESQAADDWRKGGSPFDSSSPMFSAYGKVDVDEEAAVGRMASVSLLGALSAEDAVSAEIVITRFVDEIVSFKDDPAFYVRKEAAVALGPLSRYLSDEDVERRLLPAFDIFCEDKIWHVRQAACSSLPAIFKKITGDLRRRRVVALLRAFSNDVSRNVRTAALEVIGEAIYLFHGEEEGVPEELVRFFLNEPFDGPHSSEDHATTEGHGEERSPSPGSGSFLFADFGFAAALNGNNNGTMHSRKDSHWGSNFMGIQGGDPERPLIMAYNFPAVVLTLGGAAWPRLRQAHGDLCADPSSKVRQCLGASLHELGKLIGAEGTENDLLPVLHRYLTTEEDPDVKASALENTHVILAHLPRDTAIRHLSALRDMWSTSFAYDWRLREGLALQVPMLADHFVLEDEEGSLMSIMQVALSDPVSAVRDAGVKAVPSLYKNFAEHDQTIADGVLGMLADMGESSSYRERVGFLLAARALVESRIQRSSFQLIVLPRLISLGSDPVVDVRMALTRAVHLMCTLDELYASEQSRSPELVELLRKLVTDSSTLVRDTIVDLFDSEDPIRNAEPQAGMQGRRELILGPAEGGPHRPEPAVSMWEQEGGNAQQSSGGPFSMDEDEHDDEQREGMVNGLVRLSNTDDEDNGDDADVVHMSEHDIDSDQEMVNIEADSSMFDDDDDEDDDGPFGMQHAQHHPYEGFGPAHGQQERAEGSNEDTGADDSYGSQEEAPHHLLSVGGGSPSPSYAAAVAQGGSGSTPLGLSMNGYAEGMDPEAYSLTSPERTRTGGSGPAAEQGGVASSFGSSVSTNSGSPQSNRTSGSSSDPTSSSSDGSDDLVNERNASSKPVDPFLSFVSGALGPPSTLKQSQVQAQEKRNGDSIGGDAEEESVNVAAGGDEEETSQ